MSKASTEYLVTPGPQLTLENGAPAIEMQTVKLDPESAYTLQLIESGRLIESPSKSKSKAKENA